MNTFHKVTLQIEMTPTQPNCPGDTGIAWRLARAMANKPMAPDETQRPRNVHTGSSAKVIFIIGQLKPQPSVSTASRIHIERGSVWDCIHLTPHPLPELPPPLSTSGERGKVKMRRGNWSVHKLKGEVLYHQFLIVVSVSGPQP